MATPKAIKPAMKIRGLGLICFVWFVGFGGAVLLRRLGVIGEMEKMRNTVRMP